MLRLAKPLNFPKLHNCYPSTWLSSNSLISRHSLTSSLISLKMTHTASLPNGHPILSKLQKYPSSKPAIGHLPSLNSYSYGQLLTDISYWREQLIKYPAWQTISSRLTASKGQGLPLEDGIRVAIMGENSYQFVTTFYTCLTLPQTVAVPLCTNHTDGEISFVIQNSQASFIITPSRFKERLQKIITTIPDQNIEFLVFEDIQPEDQTAPPDSETETIKFVKQDIPINSGMMLYTSGTSGKPKGVLTPISTFIAQAYGLAEAWNINPTTNFLHNLPLHHVHGILNALTVPLLRGGSLQFQFPFNPDNVLNALSNTKGLIPSMGPINTYTAVPTIYNRLINLYNKKPPSEQEGITNGIVSNLKLVMCGSAALPLPLREAWDKLSGGNVPLLERYGMTETGITLSQPLDPKKRIAGTVGKPVPGVIARVIDNDNGDKEIYRSNKIDQISSSKPEKIVGELEIGGDTVFDHYWYRDEANAESLVFDTEGTRWFKTGDIVSINADDLETITILGRSSMDIIKSGGEKISALEIEKEILSLYEIDEAAVIGLPDEEWGQVVTAVLKVRQGVSSDGIDRNWLKTKLNGILSGYKIPKNVLIVESIPRNQMGKVNKKSLARDLFPEYFKK